MLLCEYLFKSFNSRGTCEYLETWASQVDEMAEQGWEVLECVRTSQRSGQWTVLLCRTAENAPRNRVGPNHLQ
jgi:hypothetical protein